MYYVYIIESLLRNELYIGFTNDLRRRLDEHNSGSSIATKRYIPWKLIYYEACLDKKDATRREKYMKTSQGRRLLKRRLKEYLFNRKLIA